MSLSLKKNNKQSGFSLIELLVVVGTLTAVSAVAAGILTISLRGTGKTTTLTNIRQSGGYVLSQITKTLRDSYRVESIGGYSPASACIPVTDTVAPTPTSYFFNSVTVTLTDGSQKTFTFAPTGTIQETDNNVFNPTPSPTPFSLLDSSVVLDTDDPIVKPYSFSCTRDSAFDPPKITIKFSLKAAGSSTFLEKNGNIPFETTVALQNISN